MNSTTTQIRGSSLLLVGRGVSVSINFLTQVIIVRVLSTLDFGAFAYGLSVVAFFQAFSTLGLQSAIPRFVPIYHERKEVDKLFGTMVLAALVIIVMIVSVPLALRFIPSSVYAEHVDARAVALLSVMAFLIPIQALDSILGSFFASLTNPKTIFFRTHVLAPGIKLIVALLLVAMGSNLKFLAYGYVVGSAVGVAVCVAILFTILRRKGLLHEFSLSRVTVPAKELFSFSIPVLTSELVTGGMLNSIAVLMLARFCSTTEVAFYRVVVPAAMLNMTVLSSFSLLYTPLAARMFARHDYKGINVLYWKTTIWMLILSLPVFLVTFSMSRPVTVLLYGSRYAESGPVLAILSFGYFFNVALGLNTQTLRVFGAVRYILVVNILSVVAGTALTLALIPPFGAIGAAVGTSATLVIRNLLTHVGMRMGSEIHVFEVRYLKVYLHVVGAALTLLLFQRATNANVYESLIVAGALSLAVFALSSSSLAVAETFPELLKRGPIRSIHMRREQLRRFIATRLSKLADAAVVACSTDHDPSPEPFRLLLSREVGVYQKVAALVDMGAAIYPRLRAQIFTLLCRAPFPFASADVSVLSAGSGATVFLVRSPEQDCVVKVYRRSHGKGVSGLIEVAKHFRAKYDFVALRYRELVPPEEFIVFHGPELRRPVAAAVQPYIGGQKLDLLFAFNDEQLLKLAAAHEGFRSQLVFFAEQTLRIRYEEDKCLDFLGRNNVFVSHHGSSPRIWIIDNGVFDLRVLRTASPDTMLRLERQIARLGVLLRQLILSPPLALVPERSNVAAD